jgi:hypothetical protein
MMVVHLVVMTDERMVVKMVEMMVDKMVEWKVV